MNFIRRRLKFVCTVLLILPLISGCVRVRADQKGKRSRIEGQAGRLLPKYSLSVDANYDPRLDDLIYGYKLLPLIIRNFSLRPIPMDAKKDRWIVVGEKGTRYHAINSIRLKDPVIWREIPDKMRTMIDYPEIIPINYSVTFDLLFPKKAKLEYFREIRYYNAALRQEFVIEKEY